MPEVRVLQTIDTLGMGGAETWLMETLRLWAGTEGAPRMDFLATSGNPGLFDDEARRLGARVHYVPFGRRTLPAFVQSFQSILRGTRYGALHDHQDRAAGWHLLAGLGALPPVRVVHVHSPSYQIRSNYGVSAARRATAAAGRVLVRRLSTHVTGTSHKALAAYGFAAPAFTARPADALYCGFRTERFLGDLEAERASLIAEFGWPSDARVILFAGRIDRSADPADAQAHKNAPLAVQIGIACASADPRVRLLFAGQTSPAVPALERQIADAGLADRFVFAGVRNDIERLMLGSHVLLFPSREEGLGMVAVEAQAAGLPVVASTGVPRECTVVPDLVEFVPLSASVNVWAEAVLRRIRETRCALAEANARVAASPFSIAASARRLEALYCDGTL